MVLDTTMPSASLTSLTAPSALGTLTDGQTSGSTCAGQPSSDLTNLTCCRDYIQAPAAEFMGAFILCLFGCGGNCQANLSADTKVFASAAGVGSRHR